jgi:2-keto-4-pentenoate hydratase/2-oxohepta-3-ene-1,7-dioic acid hydratase in catechol pathway
MRLATLRTPNGNRAVRVEGDTAIELGAPDVGALLALPDWREHAAARGHARHSLAEADLAPVVPRPGKIFCVGLNYRTHILEMGRELPEYPTLFAKFPEALVRYISRIVTLNPGDVIATGTPGGVGHARKPPRYLTDGSVLVTEIDGIGRLSNVARAITAVPV